MKRRNLALMASVLVLTVGLTACGAKEDKKPAETTPAPATSEPAPATSTPSAEPATSSDSKEFTVEDLAKYNGKDGQKAYIAVDDIVYDVTDDPEWKNGEYAKNKDLKVGEDITKKAESTTLSIESMKEVGTLKK